MSENHDAKYWRSLADREAAAAPAPAPAEASEFPASVFEGVMRRRDFLGLMAASAAMAGLTACKKPAEVILPYDAEPDAAVPGKPLLFATTLTLSGYGRGALVRSHEGRPTKVEGNALHPDSLGAADAFMQAAVLGLYDPDRSQAVFQAGRPSSWSACARALAAAVDAVRPARGAGLRVLTAASTSPTLAAQMQALRRALPQARWHVHEPAGANAAAGARLAFGAEREVRYDLSAADAVVALSADPLYGEPGSLAYARAFGDRRDPEGARPPLRLYAAETGVSLTGAAADHRLPVRPSELPGVLAALSRALGLRVEGPALPPAAERWAAAAAADLRAAGPRGLVIAGARLAPELQAWAHALNARLGSAGRAAVCQDRVTVGPAAPDASFAELCADMAAGRVAALLVLGCNPVYSAAAGLGFAEALARVPYSLHAGLHRDETGHACSWHVPLAHPLESWSDARAFDGTASIQQPLIAPLYGGLDLHDLLSTVLGARRSGHDAVRAHWGSRGLSKAAFDRALHDGVLAGTQAPLRSAALSASWRPPRVEAPHGGVELSLRPSPAVHDGALANNAWLQELPDPITKLVWGNAALLSPALARRLAVSDGDELSLTLHGRAIKAPAAVVPGHADGAVTLALGYGRARAGRVGDGVGVSAYALRAREGQWDAAGLKVAATGARLPLIGTQGHQTMEGRDLIREAAYCRFKRAPDFARDPALNESLYAPAPPRSDEHAWAMTVDLSRCIGCNACMLACQAENNVPVVGAEEVARGRHMSWIRVDRYFKGEPDAPQGLAFQPVPCMHCEHAPCEPVCPTGATVHSPEGLNEMVYNRCVGTRYCSNNCPYKVRRFNFFRFAPEEPSLQLAANPDVTVRERGVMEKCTYCVQRIQCAKGEAEREGRPMKDGDVVTACQAACPTRAILFGDLQDKASAVSKAKASPRNYGLLAELGTRPRTTYLARVTNPKPGEPL